MPDIVFSFKFFFSLIGQANEQTAHLITAAHGNSQLQKILANALLAFKVRKAGREGRAFTEVVVLTNVRTIQQMVFSFVQ